MNPYRQGDTVRVDLPNPDGIDSEYHYEIGTVEEVFEDDLGNLTGDPVDSYLYTVEFDDEDLGEMSFRHKDLQPYSV